MDLRKKLRKWLFQEEIIRIRDLEGAFKVILADEVDSSKATAGFNGQSGRTKIFSELMEKFDLNALVETGSYLGSTTLLMSAVSNLPIFSCDINELCYLTASKRLVDHENVRLFHMDSREFIKKLASDDLAGKHCFFYLDAHWNEDCPLEEEITLIADAWDRFVIMIDDFQVPGDDGYAYDSYGDNIKFNLAYIEPVVEKYGLSVFFPAIRSQDENIKRPRGCVVLSDADNKDRLELMKTLRVYKFRPF